MASVAVVRRARVLQTTSTVIEVDDPLAYLLTDGVKIIGRNPHVQVVPRSWIERAEQQGEDAYWVVKDYGTHPEWSRLNRIVMLEWLYLPRDGMGYPKELVPVASCVDDPLDCRARNILISPARNSHNQFEPYILGDERFRDNRLYIPRSEYEMRKAAVIIKVLAKAAQHDYDPAATWRSYHYDESQPYSVDSRERWMREAWRLKQVFSAGEEGADE